jgi:hypothetical protein
MQTVGVEYDVFICHASEDKAGVVGPLVAALDERGLRVWLDQMEILIGDSLTQRIDEGLAHSRFGVVVVSRAVLEKETGWVRRELDALAGREAQGGQVVVLPVWHEVGYAEVSQYSPTLAGKLAAETKDGVDAVADMILQRCRLASSKTTVAAAAGTTARPPQAGPDVDMSAFEAYRSLTKPTNTVRQDLSRAYETAEAINAAFVAGMADDALREKVQAWYAHVSELLAAYPKVKEAFDTPRATLGPQGVFLGLGTQTREQLQGAFHERVQLLKEALEELGHPSQASAAALDSVADDGGAGAPKPSVAADLQDRTPEATSAFTGLWRHTSNGLEAALVMNLNQMLLPGYDGREPPAVVRVGIAMGCDALPPDASSSTLGRKFLHFLEEGPVAALVGSVAHPTDRVTWLRLAGNGTFRLEAVLAESDGSAPTVSAFFLPPTTGQQLLHRADNVASMSLAVEPRGGPGHEQPTALTLDACHRFMCMAMALADAFNEFLLTQLQLATRPAPPTQLGVLFQAAKSLTDLVDRGDLRQLSGSPLSRQFLGYAIAEPTGKPPAEAARDLISHLCDYGLHLEDFDSALAALGEENRLVTRESSPEPTSPADTLKATTSGASIASHARKLETET